MNSSSQSFAPLTRLLWKEYRAQRALWLAMLLFGLVPQVLFRIALRDAANYSPVVWTMAVTIPFLFSIGSMAILFAGEREERTVDWLQYLAVSPLWTLMAKWSFVLMSTLIMAAILTFAALLLVWDLPLVDGKRSLVSMSKVLWIFAAFLLWGNLGSLVSRRVITSVAAMGFWWLMTMVVPVVWLPALFGITYQHPWHERLSEILLVLSFVFVGLTDVWLGWRWCQGKYLDAQVLDDLNAKLSSVLNRLWGRTSAQSRLPNRIEFDSAWRREWQRLIWQERHRESYHRSLLYLGCAICAFLILVSLNSRSDMMGGILPLIVVLPMAMGVLGFRYDGEGQPLSFLGNRGISPRMLWMAKHAVWLPRAFWIPLAIWLVAWAGEQLTSLRSYGTPQDLTRFSQAAWAFRGTVLWFIVLSYGCGHLAALVSRRVVLGIVAATAMTVIAAIWLSVMIGFEIPVWWAVGSVVIWMFALSWWRAQYWMVQNRGANLLRSLAILSVPPIAIVTAVAVWRMSEIPGFQTADEFNEFASEIQRGSQPITPADQQILDQLAASLGGFNSVNELEKSGMHSIRQGQVEAPAARDNFWTMNESRLRLIMSAVQHEHGPSPSRWLELSESAEWSSDQGLLPQQQLLHEAARLRTEDGQLGDALNFYCASLRLASFWATDTPIKHRRQAERQQELTLVSLVTIWANHPDQTQSMLQSAIRRIQTEFDLFPMIRQTLVAQYRADRTQLNKLIDHGVDYEQRHNPWQVVATDVSRFLPWERFRAERFLQQELLGRNQACSSLMVLLARPGVDAPRMAEETESRKDIIEVMHAFVRSIPAERVHDLYSRAGRQRFWLTTPMIPKNWRKANEFLGSEIVEREVVKRESILALSLLAWRKQHQAWPESLRELLKKKETDQALRAVTILDPWTGSPFPYNGGILNRSDAVAGWSPLLTTVGPNQLREVVVESTQGPNVIVEDGVLIGVRSWTGENRDAAHDDRLQLGIIDGKLTFRLPNTVRLAEHAGQM